VRANQHTVWGGPEMKAGGAMVGTGATWGWYVPPTTDTNVDVRRAGVRVFKNGHWEDRADAWLIRVDTDRRKGQEEVAADMRD
jgi:hypothetical protein